MRHPNLRWVLVVKPAHMKLKEESLITEEEGGSYLRNVDSLEEGLQLLPAAYPTYNWEQTDRTFFPL